MSQQIMISATSLRQLADLLENASCVARGLSEGKPESFPFSISELKRPQHISADDQWFWSEDWQKGEREVNEALRSGDCDEFSSMEALIADLHAHL